MRLITRLYGSNIQDLNAKQFYEFVVLNAGKG